LTKRKRVLGVFGDGLASVDNAVDGGDEAIVVLLHPFRHLSGSELQRYEIRIKDITKKKKRAYLLPEADSGIGLGDQVVHGGGDALGARSEVVQDGRVARGLGSEDDHR
jgi:hypothetical protein